MPAGGGRRPHAFFGLGHIDDLIGFALAAVLEQVQLHGGSGGGPYLEYRFAVLDHSAQVVPVVGVILHEGGAVEDVRGHGGDFPIAFDFHGVGFAHIQLPFHRDRTGDHVIVPAGELQGIQVFPVLPHVHLIQIQPARGADEIFDLRGRYDARKRERADGVQGLSAVRAGILHAVAGQQVNLRVLSGHDGVAVFFHVLGGAAPGFGPRIGAVLPHDEAYLAYILRHVDHTFHTVITGIKQRAAAILAGKPDPHVALGIIRLGIVPVQGKLAASRFLFQEVFFLRARACQHGNRQQQCQQPRQTPTNAHLFRPFPFSVFTLPSKRARVCRSRRERTRRLIRMDFFFQLPL